MPAVGPDRRATPCSGSSLLSTVYGLDCAQFCWHCVNPAGYASEVFGRDRRIKVFLNEEAYTRGSEISGLEDDVARKLALQTERPAHVIRIDQVAGYEALRIIRRNRARYRRNQYWKGSPIRGVDRR